MTQSGECDATFRYKAVAAEVNSPTKVQQVGDGASGPARKNGRTCVDPLPGNMEVPACSMRLRVFGELFHATRAPSVGLLSVASTQHTRGATPRHFQFDGSG